MIRLGAGIVFALFCANCTAPRGPVPASPRTYGPSVAEFVGPQGRIRIDAGRLTITIGDAVHPLTDCSNAEFHCFRNDALGFHIAFVRSCATWPRIGGEAVGGAVFAQFAGVPHGDSRQGRYASALSERFSYEWFREIGLAEILYDPSGARLFGDRQWYRGEGNYPAWEPYAYRLAPGRSFLRCRGRRR